MRSALAWGLGALCASGADGLALPSTWGSSMVLQSGIAHTIRGVDVPGAVVTTTYAGNKYPATCDASGAFAATLPAQPVSASPAVILLNSSSGASIVLDDILHGDVFVFSGQSNMQSSVGWQIDYANILAGAAALGPTLRLFQVARLDAYGNVTTPQTNLTASIPWSRASAASAVGISALGYLFGAQAVAAHPGVPIGVIDSSWGGTAIQPWMSAAALAKCGAAASPPPAAAALVRAASAPGATREDIVLGVLGAATLEAERVSGQATPGQPSTLYNSMIAPLLADPIKGIFWYQGESNVGDPLGYQCLQPAMIVDWRASWAAAGSGADVPFAFVQLAAWPTMDAPTIPIFRVSAVTTSLSLPRVGMLVAADESDPAGAFHPIHPPWKAELARRAWLWADNVVYGNASSPAAGPRVVSAVWDAWQPSWGDFHWGTGGGSYVCTPSGPFFCGGIRLTFDQPIALRSFYTVTLPATPALHTYGFVSGAASGFEAWKDANTTAPLGWFQPVAITGILADGVTLQLNITWIPPTSPPTPYPGVLRYAFHDYPAAMPVIGVAGGLPAGPFNVTVTLAPAGTVAAAPTSSMS